MTPDITVYIATIRVHEFLDSKTMTRPRCTKSTLPHSNGASNEYSSRDILHSIILEAPANGGVSIGSARPNLVEIAWVGDAFDPTLTSRGIGTQTDRASMLDFGRQRTRHSDGGDCQGQKAVELHGQKQRHETEVVVVMRKRRRWQQLCERRRGWR